MDTDQPRRLSDLSGEDLLEVLGALSNPHRLRILSTLWGRREYVSQLAREIGMSRPLLYLHLQKLEAAGLVTGSLELSDDGKAMKYFEVQPFVLEISADAIRHAASTLGSAPKRNPRPEEQE